MTSHLWQTHTESLKKKLWQPFRICLLNSTANPAQFGWKRAKLALLFKSMTLFHKWGVKNDFTSALQFFMLTSDSLGGEKQGDFMQDTWRNGKLPSFGLDLQDGCLVYLPTCLLWRTLTHSLVQSVCTYFFSYFKIFLFRY